MAQMASGANFVKGTFTVPDDAYGDFVVPFGKSFSKYLFFIEMTPESKTKLLNESTITSNRYYALIGMYPYPTVSNGTTYPNATMAYRIIPSTGESTSPANTSAIVTRLDSTSITFLARGISNAAVVYQGYSYNYYIVEIK